MAIRKIFFISTLIILVTGIYVKSSSVKSQKEAINFINRDIRIDSSKPSVFLTFEKFEEFKHKSSSKFTKCAFLKMHNNTNYPIAVDANFDTRYLQLELLTLTDGTVVQALPDNAVVDICFDVDVVPYVISKKSRNKVTIGIQKKPKNPAENDKTTCFWRSDELSNGDRAWIKSQQSITFSVPSDYLKENLKISTLFNYEWEFHGGKLNFDEPKHKVYFCGSHLPKN